MFNSLFSYICIMKSSSQTSESNFLMGILAIIGVLFIVSLIVKLAKDFQKNTSTEIISKEGIEILRDNSKRVKLRDAVDQYHQTGNWDGLDKVI